MSEQETFPQVSIEKELRQSYLEYSLSVIIGAQFLMRGMGSSLFTGA